MSVEIVWGKEYGFCPEMYEGRIDLSITKNVAYFHRIDYDGRSSAALVKMYLKAIGQDVELIDINYGETIDFSKIDKDTRVFMVDFTLAIQKAAPEVKASPMYQTYDQAGEFIWLDHHGSSLEDVRCHPRSSEVTFKGLRTTRYAGCELTWLYLMADDALRAFAMEGTLFPDSEEYQEAVPRLIYLLGRFDAWDKDNRDWNNIEAFQFGFRLWGPMWPDKDYSAWEDHILDKVGIFYDKDEKTTKQGYTCLAYKNIQDEDYLERHGYECELFYEDTTKPSGCVGGVTSFEHKLPQRFFAVNTGSKGSQTFESLKDKYDGFIAYNHTGEHWSVSIYSFDLERCHAQQICILLGGGGHPGAAGFVWETTKQLPFRKI